MRYTDELEPLLELEQRQRRAIALRIAEEAGERPGELLEAHLIAADEAIAAWSDEGEQEQDMAAFRPIGPLQQLLIDHRQACDRIADIRDRRLS